MERGQRKDEGSLDSHIISVTCLNPGLVAASFDHHVCDTPC